VLFAGDDKTLNYSSSLKRLASMGRLMTPRSPSGNAFDYSGDSEDEGTALADEDATIYSQNVDSSADYINVCAYWVQALQSF
jgi:AMP deaminase